MGGELAPSCVRGGSDWNAASVCVYTRGSGPAPAGRAQVHAELLRGVTPGTFVLSDPPYCSEWPVRPVKEVRGQSNNPGGKVTVQVVMLIHSSSA